MTAASILHALSDHFLALAGIGMMIVFAAGVATEALQALFGTAGTGIALVALLILGNPATGVAFSPAMLPGFWRAIGFWLPPGAGVRAETGAVYFQGHATLGALGVLAVYAAVGAALALVMVGLRARRDRGSSSRRRRPDDALGRAAGALPATSLSRPSATASR